MMRLGDEFGIFLIFSSRANIPTARLENDLRLVTKKHGLSIGVKKITRKQAATGPAKPISHIVSVHGPDRPGIVYHVTSALARRRFNITDLSTHRTTHGAKPGYVLFIEGEIRGGRSLAMIRADLARLRRSLKTRIEIRAVEAESL